MTLSFKNLFFGIGTLFLFFAFLILAKTILIPLAFALLLSFILYPLATRYELWGMNALFAAFLSIFTMLIIIAGGVFLFSTQIIDLSRDFTDIQDKILIVFADITLFANKNLNFLPTIEKGELLERIKKWLTESSGSLVQQTFSSTASVVTGLFLTIIYTFLILIYRGGIINAFSRFFPENKRAQAYMMFSSVQKVGQQYLSGMLIIIVILGTINSIGLLIIGIEHPFLFGFLAAVLAIIPYVGTTLGAAIPVVYALVTYDSAWMALAVMIMFWAVQVVESNFLTPKIVGGNLKVNALTAILSIIIGASVWGVAGMILFLPFAAMLRVFCDEYDDLKAIALLIGEQNNSEEVGRAKFLTRWRERIKGWFSK
ncbi:MAG: AI-2E family transporter [Bacteroidetes bacterium HGW-Bacteroidetes-11]|nr:MAG: AI-2E family transporter [Bacteroidetes bacterium HGW-Bacteroidetes-11]